MQINQLGVRWIRVPAAEGKFLVQTKKPAQYSNYWFCSILDSASGFSATILTPFFGSYWPDLLRSITADTDVHTTEPVGIRTYGKIEMTSEAFSMQNAPVNHESTTR
jgi:hypothetical protein